MELIHSDQSIYFRLNAVCFTVNTLNGIFRRLIDKKLGQPFVADSISGDAEEHRNFSGNFSSFAIVSQLRLRFAIMSHRCSKGYASRAQKWERKKKEHRALVEEVHLLYRKGICFLYSHSMRLLHENVWRNAGQPLPPVRRVRPKSKMKYTTRPKNMKLSRSSSRAKNTAHANVEINIINSLWPDLFGRSCDGDQGSDWSRVNSSHVTSCIISQIQLTARGEKRGGRRTHLWTRAYRKRRRTISRQRKKRNRRERYTRRCARYMTAAVTSSAPAMCSQCTPSIFRILARRVATRPRRKSYPINGDSSSKFGSERFAIAQSKYHGISKRRREFTSTYTKSNVFGIWSTTC